MTFSLHKRIEELGRKLKRLSQRLNRLESDNIELRERNADLESENERLRVELTSARNDAEFLTMSHRLATDADDIIKLRRRVEGMIRDIDRCISQLKE